MEFKNEYPPMTEEEMLEAIKAVYCNFHPYKNRKIFEEMYQLMSDMVGLLEYDCNIHYPIEMLHSTPPIEEQKEFDF